MAERLSDERVQYLASDELSCMVAAWPEVRQMARELLALRAENARLREAGPAMPEVPSDQIVARASTAIEIGANGWDVYRIFRNALIAEQKERGR